MKVDEIFQNSRQIVGLEGMTVNERLSESGLMETFEEAKKKDKAQAEMILFGVES